MYFIVTKTAEAVEDEICKVIYDGGFDGKLTYITPRSKNRESKEIALAALSTVVKVRDWFLFLFTCGSYIQGEENQD